MLYLASEIAHKQGASVLSIGQALYRLSGHYIYTMIRTSIKKRMMIAIYT